MCDFASDNERQIKMIEIYAIHLSHLWGRDVSVEEAAFEWIIRMADRYQHKG